MTGSERTARTLEVTAELADWIRAEGARSAIIGAVAMAVHGYARSTADLDLATELDPANQLTQLGTELEKRGYAVDLNLPDAEDPLGGVLTVTGPDFDDVQVVNFHNPASLAENPGSDALDHAGPLSGSSLRVVTLADLILLKLYAGGLKSLADVVGLLEANPKLDPESLRDAARRFGLEAELDRVIDECRE